jgi:hypothetical protein
MVPSFCQRARATGASRIVYLPSGTLDRLRKLDMVKHCKWIPYGTEGSGGKGCSRMRPKLHLPVFGHAFRVTGVMAKLVGWKAVLYHIDLFESSH